MSTPTMKGELMFPSRYLAAPDLGGRDMVLTVAKIEKASLQTTKGAEDKWVVSFREVKKLLVLNKTNARTMADVLGTKAETWTGKRVTLYATTCAAFGKMTDCIRVREVAPPSRIPDDEPPVQA